MRIKSITPIKPVKSRCISVDAPDRLFAVGGDTGEEVLTHNSVAQRNVVVTTIMRGMGGKHAGKPGAAEKYGTWKFLGIDLKKVELSAFRKYSQVVLGIATELEDALTVLRFGQQTMMKRYSEMEALGVNNFQDLPEKGQSLLIMVDEAGELLDSSGVKALVGSTLIQSPEGLKKLEEIMVGDTIYDPEWNPTIVQKKYIPEEQDSFELEIRNDRTEESESFIAGAEHYWVIIMEGEEKLVTTSEMYELFNKNDESLIKFRRSFGKRVLGGESVSLHSVSQLESLSENLVENFLNEEWFSLEGVVPVETSETLYCISVDAPSRQFLIGGLAVPTHNTEEGKQMDLLKGEAQIIIGSILRLGRAAGVHILLATQRPDAKLIPGEMKANMTTRINCGYTNPTASSMILDSSEGSRVRGNPRGRLYVKNHNTGFHGQGFFQGQDWIDEWLANRGLNPDGSPLGSAKQRVFDTSMEGFAEGDLDSRAGISNKDYIEQLASGEIPEEQPSQQEHTPTEESIEEGVGTMGRPVFEDRSEDSMDQFHRPEEDFDSVLEDLINENNE